MMYYSYIFLFILIVIITAKLDKKLTTKMGGQVYKRDKIYYNDALIDSFEGRRSIYLFILLGSLIPIINVLCFWVFFIIDIIFIFLLIQKSDLGDKIIKKIF